MYVLAVSMLTPLSHAEESTATLEKQATEYDTLKMISSKGTDPVGMEGLWGMEGDFIVAASCDDTFGALADIPSYPKYTSSVKKVEIIKQTLTSLTVDYTEGGFGFESTSQQEWTLQPTNSPPTITSISVGATDPPSWVQFQLYPVASPNYCQIDLKMFADMSMVPSFLMSWVSSKAAEELTTTYRSIIQGHQGTKP